MNKTILAIDPANEKPAFVLVINGILRKFGKHNNEKFCQIMDRLCVIMKDKKTELDVYIEFPFPRGEFVSWQLFATCAFCGELKALFRQHGIKCNWVNRTNVKVSITGKANTKDGQVRAAILERKGGKAVAIGNKKNPGEYYGVAADVWQALAIAVMVENGDYKPYEQYIAEQKQRSLEKREKRKQKKLEAMNGKTEAKTV